MDAELLELQKQFEFAQEAKSSVRLSDRNVVELVQKLQLLHIIDFDLLHTVSGKEYITPDQLRHEIEVEIKKRGRVSLIDLADIIGVDLYHVEKQAQNIVSNDSLLMLINGEIITTFYWDAVAEEINERLQECSQIALAEIAAQYQVGSELLVTVLEPRLGNLVKGRLEGGQLYTPAYVTRVNAMVRGSARGVTVPMNLSALWSSLQLLLQEMDGASGVAVDGSFFQSLFNGLVKEGEILGSVRAGVHWTPTVFATAQKDSVDAFFSQNSFISYEALNKLGIPSAIQFLQARYPEGIPLVTVFVHSSMIDILDAAVEDAIERGSWIDSLTVLPAAFASQDASKILSLCPSIQVALKSNEVHILGDSYVFSKGFVKNLFDSLDKESQTSSLSALFGTQAPESSDTSIDSKDRSKKKRGKSSGNAKTGAAENSPDNQEPVPNKSKRNQKKGKAMAAQVSDLKPGAKKNADKMTGDNINIFPERLLIERINKLVPEFEEQGIGDQEIVLSSLAQHLRPMLLHSWQERRKAVFTDNAQRMKHVLDNLQKKLDESSLNMQLYEKALDLFEDDPSTSVLLHRHLLRSTATPMVDTLLLNLDMHNKLKNGVEVEESQNPESVSFSSAERLALAKSLPGSLSAKAFALVEALEGKRVENFLASLREMAEESGISLKKLDKKLERTLLHSYRKDLVAQVAAETDPVALLPKVVSLFYIQVHSRALQAPGRAISVAVGRLKDKLDKSAHKILVDYHSATVSLLALISAGTGEKEDCSSDRILSKRELLESLIPALKGLVLGTPQP
ncbi:E3 UFM1-protein ligase 1-like [Heracleum sosnowskyi]|uniref:E3 UFM1-protein ligase 1-like n=1 Tax=Heracleum sosnowskyi TaxID=360622 RepID=A0AAD8HWJ6_9APIA|nr:E3 UFM1-protein ligase 1-like [Heracleum sosnowskyi]